MVNAMSHRGDEPTVVDSRTFSYTLDAHDRIVAVNAEWEAFARENGAPTLPERVIGTTLWQYLADVDTRYHYAQLFWHARAYGETIRLPYRCDAPGLVREMEMEIIPYADGRLELRTSMRRQRARAPAPLLDADVLRSEELIIMCGWCKRVELGGAWYDIDELRAQDPRFETELLPSVSHGMCDDCQAMTLVKLSQLTTGAPGRAGGREATA